MEKFEFIRVHTVQEALEALNTLENPCLVSGSTNIINDIRAGRLKGGTLVDISTLGELDFIKAEDGKIKIGARACLADIAENEMIRENAPALYMAANVFADPNTRNRATVAGNIADASPAADSAPSLVAFDAIVNVESVNGKRAIPITEFLIAPRTTALQRNEMITSVEFLPHKKSAFYKIGYRNAMAISIATCAAALELNDDGTVKEARIALGSVAPTAKRAYDVEQAMVGHHLTENFLDSLADMISGNVQARITSVTRNYRIGVTPVIVKRACLAALEK